MNVLNKLVDKIDIKKMTKKPDNTEIAVELLNKNLVYQNKI